MHFSQDGIVISSNTYINLSAYDNFAEDDAVVASKVMRQSDELDLLPRRTLGSNPSRNAPSALSSVETDNEPIGLWK